MLGASYWQYQRHLFKKVLWEKILIKANADPLPLAEVYTRPPEEINYQRVTYQGKPLYDHEFKIMNRRKNGIPGFHLIVPLKIFPESGKLFLLNRGYVPLKFRKTIEKLPRPQMLAGTALVKLSVKPKSFLAPQDPLNLAAREWLRVDIPLLSKHMNLELSDFWLENLKSENVDIDQIFYSQKSGKDDILNMVNSTSRKVIPSHSDTKDLADYPEPDYSTEIPANRHLGYVFEWIFLAIMTLGGTLLMSRIGGNKSQIGKLNPN